MLFFLLCFIPALSRHKMHPHEVNADKICFLFVLYVYLRWCVLQTRELIDDMKSSSMMGSKNKLGDPEMILRILCHRSDSEANQFLKKQYKLPRSAVQGYGGDWSMSQAVMKFNSFFHIDYVIKDLSIRCLNFQQSFIFGSHFSVESGFRFSYTVAMAVLNQVIHASLDWF